MTALYFSEVGNPNQGLQGLGQPADFQPRKPGFMLGLKPGFNRFRFGPLEPENNEVRDMEST